METLKIFRIYVPNFFSREWKFVLNDNDFFEILESIIK